MKKVLLLHGWGGKKEEHWLTWLEALLVKQGYDVYFPKIPNNYNPKFTKWLTCIDTYVAEFEPDTVIAHSLGAIAWWHYQTNTQYKLQTLISVAPPTFASFPSKMESFFPLPSIDFKHTMHSIIFAENDKNILLSDLTNLAASSKIKLVSKEKGEHLDHFSKTYTLEEILPILHLPNSS